MSCGRSAEQQAVVEHNLEGQHLLGQREALLQELRDKSGKDKKDSKGRDIKVQGVWAKEMVMLGKMPHMLACLLTLVISFGTVIGMLVVVGNSFADFADNEAQKKADGQRTQVEGKILN